MLYTSLSTFGANTVTIDETTSARFLRELKATPNKAIGNLLISDSAKKRKVSDNLAAADAKKSKTEDTANAADGEKTTADLEAEFAQLVREDKIAKLQQQINRQKESDKKALGGIGSVADTGR